MHTLFFARRRAPRGFTLIELLVVIAMIATLAAILFPVFAKAREKGRQTACASNEKQIMLAVLQYVQDNDETYPHTAQYLNYTTYPTLLWPQTLYPYTKSTGVFQCPDDSNTAVPSYATNPPPAGYVAPFHTSYLANFDVSLLDTFGNVTLAQVAQPSSTVYLCDGGVQSQAAAPYTTSSVKNPSWILDDPGHAGPLSATNTDWAGPNARHTGFSEVAFLDGHVKAMSSDRWYYPGTPWLKPAVGGG